MNKTILTILTLFLIPFYIGAQNNDTFEIQADIVNSSSNSEIQIFNKKFNDWLKSLKVDSLKMNLKDERMVNDFILFSEDGLMMKDFKFHSVESCKNKILTSLPSGKNKNGENDWIYVTMESHINKTQLIEVLEFLRNNKIDYHFGQEDEFIPKYIKKQ